MSDTNTNVDTVTVGRALTEIDALGQTATYQVVVIAIGGQPYLVARHLRYLEEAIFEANFDLGIQTRAWGFSAVPISVSLPKDQDISMLDAVLDRFHDLEKEGRLALF